MNDLIRRTDALLILYDFAGCIVDTPGGHYRKAYEAYRRKLETLPAIQPENGGCPYCHEDSDGYVKPIEKNCHAFVCFGMNGWELSLKANGWHGSAKIRYCPMCGRELT